MTGLKTLEDVPDYDTTRLIQCRSTMLPFTYFHQISVRFLVLNHSFARNKSSLLRTDFLSLCLDTGCLGEECDMVAVLEANWPGNTF